MSGLLKILGQIIRILFAKSVESSSVDLEKNETQTKETTTSDDVAEPLPYLPYSNIEFKNNSDRLELEFMELKEKNIDLHNLLVDCGNYCEKEFGKNIVITMIYRTEEEQDEIYKDDPKYKVKKFKSPHQFFHSADLRSSNFEASEIKKIEDYLNNKYNKSNYYKWTARNHNVGLGDHFHIQIARV